MSVLQLIEGGDDRRPDITEILNEMNVVAAWLVDIASPAEITTTALYLDDWLTTHRLAADLRVKALKLECLALRRLGQIHPTHPGRIPAGRNMRLMAKRLAELDDENFSRLMDYVGEFDTLDTVNQLWRRVINHDIGEAAGKGVYDAAGGGKKKPPVKKPVAEKEIPESGDAEPETLQAVHILLGKLLKETTEPFTVSDMVIKLQQTLLAQLGDAGTDLLYDDDVLEGLAEQVRYALRTEMVYDGCPAYITYQLPDDSQWLRVPWYLASLDQLNAMVVFRDKQAQILALKAASLADLANKIGAYDDGSGTGKVADLYQQWVVGQS